MPAFQRRVCHHESVALLQLQGRSKELGMVGDNEEVERSAQLRLLTGRGCDLLAARKAVGLNWPEVIAEDGGIE